MKRKILGIITGIIIWYFLLSLESFFITPFSTKSLKIDSFMTALYPFVAGFFAGVIAKSNEITISLISLTIAYLPALFLQIRAADRLGIMKSSSGFPIIILGFIYALFFAFLGGLGAMGLRKYREKRKKHDRF